MKPAMMRHVPWLAALFLAACGAPERAAIQARLDAAGALPERLVEAQDLEGLPAPLAHHLRRAGVVGRPYIRALRARGEGEILNAGRWLRLDQAFYATLAEPSRDWLAETGSGGLAFRMAVHDSYAEGEGRMSVRMFEDVPFQAQRGPEMTASALVTLLAEFMHMPTGFLEPYVTVEEAGANAVRARLEHAGYVVSATFHFDDAGDLRRVTSDDRFAATDDGGMVPCAWSAECLRYAEVDGLRLCDRFIGTWHRDTGDEVYVRGHYDVLEPNVFELY